jgi:O-antigen ligase
MQIDNIIETILPLLIVALPFYYLLILKDRVYLFLPIILACSIFDGRYKIPIGDWPVMLIDYAIFVLVILSTLFYFSKFKIKVSFNNNFDRSILLFLTLNIIAVIIGLIKGNSTYDLIRDIRFPVYFIIMFYLISIVISNTSQLKVFLAMIIIPSVLSIYPIIDDFLNGLEVGASILMFLSFAIILAVLFAANLTIKSRILLMCALAVLVVPVFISGKRGTTFCILLCSFTLFFLYRNKMSKILSILTLMGGLTFAVFSIYDYMPSQIQNAMSNATDRRIYQTIDEATNRMEYDPQRYYEWQIAFDEAAKSPFFGNGLGYTHYFYVRGEAIYDKYSWYHNSYLFYLVKTGYIGLSILIFFILSLSYYSYKCYKSAADGFIKGALSGLFAFSIFVLIGPLFGSGLAFGLESSGVFLGILFGLVSVLDRLTNESASNIGIDEVLL